MTEERLREYLIWTNKNVRKLIYKYHLNSFEKDELVSQAYLGLSEAINKYDKRSKASFKTYAYYRINGCVLDYLRDSFRKRQEKELFLSYNSKNLCPEKEFEKKEIRNLISKEVNKLNKKERKLIKEHYFFEKSFSEIIKENQHLKKSWASKLHKKALLRIKYKLERHAEILSNI